ncbi:FHA domain-containing protein [Roseovarius lutimaris]|uniref:FHA domain-containing protein n=1 Tax=Roseovarius lutimaris TaxID=1005928 RepID=A0A1I5F771_9RHOB|nr:FHA domain-containing protein [Roseovarius lutimaris]SFO19496.1 FHA domain-containing protein [Roseovarius lutimaris]
MTLFKRVFASHTNGEAITPTPPARPEGPEAELGFDDDLIAGMAAFAEEPTEEPPFDHAVPVAPSDEPAKLDAPFHHDLGHQPALNPDMAERAAQAQREIETSQNRRVAQTPADDMRAAPPTPEHIAPPGIADQSEAADAPAAPSRPGRGARRVRTRMLGFDQGIDAVTDPFAKQGTQANAPTRKYPVGWMVVVAGPGKGHSFAIFNGVSTIGRGAEQSVVLDFGDTSISREKHAAVAYDDEQNSFFLGHGGKSNIVRLNGRPVLSTEDLSHGDSLRIGETTLRFVALCGTEFTWGPSGNDEL